MENTEKGVETASPRDTFRAAATNKLINNPEEWFDFLKMRNLTYHVYNEETLDLVVKIFDEFSIALDKVIKTIMEQ